MTLQERVDSDLKDAMRAKDAVKLGVLRMLKSALELAAPLSGLAGAAQARIRGRAGPGDRRFAAKEPRAP